MKLKTMMSILMLALILLIFSGCGERIKYVYIKPKCPKLQTFEVNTSKNKHFTIHYKVIERNKNAKSN